MAMKVEELQVLISANADQFKAELQQISGKLSDLGAVAKKQSDKMGGSLVGAFVKGNIISNVLTGTLRNVGSAIANVTKAVVQNGSAYSRLKIATQTVTANMGMSAKAVDDLRDSLAESNTFGIQAENVIKTLALSGLVKLTEGMKTFDQRTGKMVEGVGGLVLTMKDLGASAGIDSAQAIDKLTKFIRRGEVSFADGVIEIGNINQEYKKFADSINKNVNDLTAEERALVRVNIVRTEGQKALGAYANTMQTSGKAFDSFGNAMRNTTEILGGFFEPALSAIGNALFQFAQSVRLSVLGSEQPIQNFANRVAGYVVTIVRIIGRALSALPFIGKNFTNLANFTIKPIEKTKQLGKSADKTSGSLNNTAKSAKNLKKELAGLAGFDQLNVLTEPDAGAGGGGGVGGGAGGGASPIAQDITPVIDAGKVNSIADELTTAINKILDPLKELYDWIGKNRDYLVVLTATITALAIWFGIFTGAINLSAIATAIWTTVTAIATGVTTALGTAIAFLTSPITLVILAIGAMVLALVWLWNNSDKVNNALKAGWDKVKEWANSLWTWLKGIFTSIGNWIGGVWTGIVDGVKSIPTKVASAFTTVWNTAKDIFTKVKDFVSGIWTGIANGVVGMVNRVLSSFAFMANNALSPLNAIIREAKNKIPALSFLQELRVPNISIPKLATGGVVSSPTVAMIGEAGREAVMPLDRNTGWQDDLAEKIATLINGTEQHLTVKLGEDTIFDRFVDWHNDKTTLGKTLLVR